MKKPVISIDEPEPKKIDEPKPKKAPRADWPPAEGFVVVVDGHERTIKAHRQRVMEKMQVHSLAELVSLAERVGILGGASGNGSTA